jgi:Mn2+/Fe2+ NRAMP family transporter
MNTHKRAHASHTSKHTINHRHTKAHTHTHILATILMCSVCVLQGFLVQMQAAKLGVVTGKNLAEMCR